VLTCYILLDLLILHLRRIQRRKSHLRIIVAIAGVAEILDADARLDHKAQDESVGDACAKHTIQICFVCRDAHHCLVHVITFAWMLHIQPDIYNFTGLGRNGLKVIHGMEWSKDYDLRY
jgi:hypothetical protein